MTTLNGLVRIDSSLAYLNIRVAGRFDPPVSMTHRAAWGRGRTPSCGQHPRLGQCQQFDGRLMARQGGRREAKKPTVIDSLA